MFRTAVLALAIASPALGATLSANPANLVAQLKAAKPGDTVTLAAGDYGARRFGRLINVPAINVDATRARFTTIACFACTGLHWTGGTIGPGPARGTGFMVDGGNDVKLAKLAITGQDFGFQFSRSTHVSIVDTTVADFGIDGGRMFCVQHGYAARLRITNGKPRDRVNHHPDAFQIASACGATKTPDLKITSDIIVEDSVFSTNGQGLTGFSHPPLDGGFDRIIFRRNRASTTYTHGITLSNCRACEVSDNVVRSLPGYLFGGAKIHVDKSSGSFTRNEVMAPGRL